MGSPSLKRRISVLARFPARWNHLAEKEPRQVNMLEQILVGEVIQLRRDLLSWKAMMNLAGLVGKRFDQIPLVSEGIAKHRDLAIGFQARLFQKLNAGLFEPGKITVKTIGFQEEKNAAARLIANGRPLLRRISPGKEEAGFAVSGRGDHHPALCGRK